MKFRLRSLLLVVTVAAIGVAIYLQVRGASLTASLRRDLKTLSVLESSLVQSGRQDGRESALVMISGSARACRLVRVSRWRNAPNPNQAQWGVDSVSAIYADGNCLFEVFDRSFDHEPTKQEIADFKLWSDCW